VALLVVVAVVMVIMITEIVNDSVKEPTLDEINQYMHTHASLTFNAAREILLEIARTGKPLSLFHDLNDYRNTG
jgi:hypothetical protein